MFNSHTSRKVLSFLLAAGSFVTRHAATYFILSTILLGLGTTSCTQNPGGTKSQDSPTDESSKKDPVASEDMGTQDSIILFFGNSLTAGYQLELEQAFPALIQQKLDSLGLPYEARNSGLSGETSTGGDARIEFVLGTLQKPLAVFVLELGANDGLRGISPEETEKSLQSIIDKIQQANPACKILLCGMEAPPNMGDDFTQKFRALFPRLAERNSTAFLPFLLNGVAGIPELNLPDGIHPTPTGHKIVAENVWTELASLVAGP